MPGSDSAFEQNLLKDYGDPIASYDGRGVLTLRDGREVSCKFEAGQLRKGDVLLLCDFLPPVLFLATISAIRFEGTTSEGYRISCDNRIMEINYLPDLPRDGRTGSFAAFRLGEMNVQMADSHTQARSVRFGVTNFQFVGTDAQQSGNFHFLTLPLKLKGVNSPTELSIRPLERYTKIMCRIRTLNITDVTCEVVSDIPEDGSIGRLKEVIDDLCYLMSVARGTTIQWIYCNHYNAADECIMRTHSPRITKPFSTSSIIDPRVDGRDETKVFLEQGYGVYVLKRDSYGLNRGTIDAYLDVKAEQDFLETRGAKLAVAMEMLKAVFLELPDSPAKEFVLDEEDFKKLVQPISEAVDKILEQKGVEKDDRKAICGDKKIEGLNRRAFRYFIDKLCKQIGLKVEEREIKLFVACRDKLVHKGRFYYEAATEQEREKCPPLPSKTHEYFFLVNFLDRIFLKLLGYSGVYIDWRVPWKPDRSQLV